MGWRPSGRLNACGEKREAENREAGKLGLKDYYDYLKDLKKIVVCLEYAG